MSSYLMHSYNPQNSIVAYDADGKLVSVVVKLCTHNDFSADDQADEPLLLTMDWVEFIAFEDAGVRKATSFQIPKIVEGAAESDPKQKRRTVQIQSADPDKKETEA